MGSKPSTKIQDFSSCSIQSIHKQIDFVRKNIENSQLLNSNCFIEKSKVEEDDDYSICYMTSGSLTCLDPAKSILVYGVIVPWIFIIVVCILLIITLCYDWKHDKKCFKHIKNPNHYIVINSK